MARHRLGEVPVVYWQTDFPSSTTSKAYTSVDEAGRIIKLWSWPSSGSTTNTWAINPTAWGGDSPITGPAVFQPMLFAGQYQDQETTAFLDDGITKHRAGIAYNRLREYDPFTGSYLQSDSRAGESWSSYVYVDSNPVERSDLDGDMWRTTSCTSHSVHIPADITPEGEVIPGSETEEMECEGGPENDEDGHDIDLPHPSGPGLPGGGGGTDLTSTIPTLMRDPDKWVRDRNCNITKKACEATVKADCAGEGLELSYPGGYSSWEPGYGACKRLSARPIKPWKPGEREALCRSKQRVCIADSTERLCPPCPAAPDA